MPRRTVFVWSPPVRRTIILSLFCSACLGLGACTTPESEEAVPTEITPPLTEAYTSSAATSSASASASSTTRAPRSSSTSTTNNSFANKDIAAVYEQFSSLAPRALFERFDSCQPNGVPQSSACTGQSVGQFQFFASQAKAASTTQLLTELRTSRVVEDTGRKVVGWSTLGTTAIITVVDNDKGVLLQQMVSSEEVDPETRIRELGLVDVEPSESDSATATPSAS